MISGHMQQPQHTPGPKPKGSAKSKTAAPGPKGKLTPTTKSASPAGAAADPTNTSTDKEKDGVDSFLMASKRKGDKPVDGLLHLSKKGKEFIV